MCAGAGQEEEETKIYRWRHLRTGQGEDKVEAVTARHPGVASTGAAPWWPLASGLASLAGALT